jgi:5-methylthioadenosine/S-adenosylhomocysteine deaminase
MRVPQFVPFRDPYSMICYSADGSETDTVILNGKVVYKNKQFVTIDIEEVYAKVAEMKEVL